MIETNLLINWFLIELELLNGHNTLVHLGVWLLW